MNGGGQLREENTKTLSKNLFEKVENNYFSIKRKTPNENNKMNQMYGQDWLNNDDLKIKKLLYTDYHEVEKMNNGLAVKW